MTRETTHTTVKDGTAQGTDGHLAAMQRENNAAADAMMQQLAAQGTDGGPAFPSGGHAYTRAVYGMSLRAYAAIKLRVPSSGIDWLDDMIRQAKRDEFAGHAMAGLSAHPKCGKVGPGYETTTNCVAREARFLADALIAKGGRS